jgi:hypothetical protein
MSREKVLAQGYYVRRKGMIHNCPTDVRMRNLWQKTEQKKMVLNIVSGSCERLALGKCVMSARNMGVHVQCSTSKSQRYEKTGREIDSRAAEKSVKNLVSGN